jgi:hypothetical protein
MYVASTSHSHHVVLCGRLARGGPSAVAAAVAPAPTRWPFLRIMQYSAVIYAGAHCGDYAKDTMACTWLLSEVRSARGAAPDDWS